MSINPFLSGALLLSALLAATGQLSAAVIEVRDDVAGPTPEVLGYNLGSFMPGSNTADWWRYSRASGARMFLSPSHFNTPASGRFGDHQVVDQDSFVNRRNALRDDPLNLEFINWSEVQNRFGTALSGNNTILPQYAFEAIQRHGGTPMGQVTLGTSWYSSDDDWKDKWIAWRTYYSIVFHMAREFGAERFTAFNEPNHPGTFIETGPWMSRVRLASDATQSAIEDVNRIYGTTLTARFVAPVTANGTGSAYTNYGSPAVQSQHTNFLDQVDSSYRLFDLFAYQQYATAASSFVSALNTVRNNVAADLPATSDPLRFTLTEYNVHTGANYDSRTDTPDTLIKAIQFASVTSQLMRHGLDEFYAFKFGMTAYPSSRNFPVQKNGMLYLDNDHAPHNYGTMTQGAEVYRLFNKAFAPGRHRLVVNVSGTGSASLDVQASHDPETGFYYVFSINEGTSGIPFDLDVSALGIPEGNEVIIEDVSQWRRGTIRSLERVENGSLSPGNQPGRTVWLITIPTLPQRTGSDHSNILRIPVSHDTTVRDGSHADSSTLGGEPAAWARNHATDASERSAAFFQFDLPHDWNPNDLQLAIIELSVAPIDGGSDSIHAHLYGIDHHDWTESNLTWNTAANLRNNHLIGNRIRHGVVTGAGESAHILGQLTASGGYTTRLVDVTDYLIRQENGKASFMITQDPRWNVDIHVDEIPERWDDLVQGDDQPDGMRIRTKEADGGGASLLLIRSLPTQEIIGTPRPIHANPGSTPDGSGTANSVGRRNVVDPETGLPRHDGHSSAQSEFTYPTTAFVGKTGDIPHARMVSTVLFFELPAVSSPEAIDHATFSAVRIDEGRQTGPGNVDIYGLGFASASTIFSDHWFAGAEDESAGWGVPSVVKIQNNFLLSGDQTTTGRIPTSDEANQQLTAFVRSLYAAGAQGGDFAVIRLSYDIDQNPNTGNIQRFVFAPPAAGENENDPILTLYIVEDEILENTFAAWQRDNFTQPERDDPAISGPTATPAGDGVENLLKFALGLPAKTMAAGRDLPQPALHGDELRLTFQRPKGLVGLEYIVEVSEDLAQWSSGMTHVEELPREETADHEILTFRAVPRDGATRTFIRLRVEQNGPES